MLLFTSMYVYCVSLRTDFPLFPFSTTATPLIYCPSDLSHRVLYWYCPITLSAGVTDHWSYKQLRVGIRFLGPALCILSAQLICVVRSAAVNTASTLWRPFTMRWWLAPWLDCYSTPAGDNKSRPGYSRLDGPMISRIIIVQSCCLHSNDRSKIPIENEAFFWKFFPINSFDWIFIVLSHSHKL